MQFCPNHIDIRFLENKDKCINKNKGLWTYDCKNPVEKTSKTIQISFRATK